ncbi:YitT family protein [Anaeropeptidivorans aminofermentans]|uniref:YitT family protein n=1 Tax=Anaeropeptidivorans aminofermentans TaxID=2934315 RepID=UPI00202578EC|nr:YitT family protein [Anaeropeptidivorans aminofermentans]MBE6010959.1 YitT family protein [Lachnospiraceae bacterium]
MIFKKIMSAMGIDSFKDFLIINFGIIIISVGLHFFRNPNKFALGGINGVSIVLNYFYPNLPVGSLMFLLNIIFLFLGFIFLGKTFVMKTLYVSNAITFMVMGLEHFMPVVTPLTNQKLLELVYSVFLPGIGVAFIYNYGAATGGTDIIAQIISKLFKIRLSISLLICDFFIALSAGYIYGMEICLLILTGLMMNSFVVDSFLENLNLRKIVVIISNKNQEIEQFICNEIKRGATVHKARGAINREERDVITTVLNRSQAKRLQDYIKGIDPEAFITISNSSKIIGLGFGSFE